MGLLIGGSYLSGASARQALANPAGPAQIRLAALATESVATAPVATVDVSSPTRNAAIASAGLGAAASPAFSKIALAAPKPAAMSLRDRFRLALSVTTSVAEPFHFRGEPARAAAAHGTDANCLAQAVYYEARGESVSGQAAVAQVVLNRVRHPAFPKTVCGVVFQKSGQGCQFSFACNGSMHSGMEPGAWRRAEQVAQRALSGAVMADVGEATQFQAARAGGWANGLLKVAQIGEHVFFRFGGHQGSAGMFHDRAEPSTAPHGGTTADVRIAALSPAATPKTSEAAQSASTLSPSTPAGPAAPKPPSEPAPVLKAPAPAMTSVKTEEVAPKPMTVAAAGA